MEFTPLVGAQSVSARGANAASFTFQAGQESVSLSGRVPHGAKQCAPQPVTAAGNRGADGSYQLRFVMEYHLGNGGAGCSSSPGTWSVELQATA